MITLLELLAGMVLGGLSAAGTGVLVEVVRAYRNPIRRAAMAHHTFGQNVRNILVS